MIEWLACIKIKDSVWKLLNYYLYKLYYCHYYKLFKYAKLITSLIRPTPAARHRVNNELSLRQSWSQYWITSAGKLSFISRNLHATQVKIRIIRESNVSNGIECMYTQLTTNLDFMRKTCRSTAIRKYPSENSTELVVEPLVCIYTKAVACLRALCGNFEIPYRVYLSGIADIISIRLCSRIARKSLRIKRISLSVKSMVIYFIILYAVLRKYFLFGV